MTRPQSSSRNAREGAGGDGKVLNHKGLCNNYLEGGGGGKLEGGIGENDNKRESGVGCKI